MRHDAQIFGKTVAVRVIFEIVVHPGGTDKSII